MIEQLRLMVIGLAMVPIHASVQFSMDKTLFDENNTLKEKEKWDTRLLEFTQELIWFANALKQ